METLKVHACAHMHKYVQVLWKSEDCLVPCSWSYRRLWASGVGAETWTLVLWKSSKVLPLLVLFSSWWISDTVPLTCSSVLLKSSIMACGFVFLNRTFQSRPRIFVCKASRLGLDRSCYTGLQSALESFVSGMGSQAFSFPVPCLVLPAFEERCV